MTKKAKREYIGEIGPRYRAASKKEQTTMLNEVVKVTRWNRKYVIRVLKKNTGTPSASFSGGMTGRDREKRTVGRPKQYDTPEIMNFLTVFWHAANQACGKRLKSVLPAWLPWYEKMQEQKTGRPLSLLNQVLLARISAATIDRLLTEERSKYRVDKGRSTTKPGTLQMRTRIPVKTEQWKEKRIGFLEVDTVAHCGSSMAGQFVFTLNTVDIASGWVEPRAVWGKGETGVLSAFQSIEEALPFPLRGFDSDNGGEFINHHMETYLHGGRRRWHVDYTRAREYKKNDNAHIEQKNWTHVRQLFGYERFDNPEVVKLMNDLYANEYSLLTNFFLPSVKLQQKERIGSRIVKRHDQPQTPCQRLLCSRAIPQETKERLCRLQQSVNPFLLHQAIKRKVSLILQHRTPALSQRAIVNLPLHHEDHRRVNASEQLRLLPPVLPSPTRQHLSSSGQRLTRKTNTIK